MYESFTDSLIQGYELKSKGYRYLDLMKEGIRNADTHLTQGKWEAKWFEFRRVVLNLFIFRVTIRQTVTDIIAWKAASNLIYGLQYGALFTFIALWHCTALSYPSPIPLVLILMVIVVHTLIHVFIAYGLQRYWVPIDFCLMILAAFLGVQFIIKKATT